MGDRRRIGPYQPFAKLGEGPATVVYKAYEPSAQRMVLLKVLRPSAARDPSVVARFEDEARLAAQIAHPNVVPVLAWSVEGAEPYLAASFIDGVDLADLLARGPVPADVAVAAAAAAAEGLQAAHDVGILHRDLKPSNVIVGYDGTVALTDFGMASLVAADEDSGERVEEVRGTLAYLSPEQVLGTPATPASDLFALGATLYEMLTGTVAFPGQTPAAVFDRIVHHDPMPRLVADPVVPQAVVEVVRHLMAKAPEARLGDAQTAAARLTELAAAFDPPPTEARVASYVQEPATYRPAEMSVALTSAAVEAAETQTSTTLDDPQQERPASSPVRSPVWYGVGIAALVLASLLGAAAWWAQRSDVAIDPTGDEREIVADEGERAGVDTSASFSGHSAPPLAASDVRSSESEVSDDGVVEPTGATQPREGLPEPTREQRPTLTMADSGRGDVSAQDAPGQATDEIEPAARGGRLFVQGAPWAAVYLDGDSIGVTALDTMLQAGAYRLALRHPDFPAYDEIIEIRAGEPLRRDVSLWDFVAQVTFEVQPWADVYLNDRFLDTLPQDRPFVIPPGEHRIRLAHPSYGAWDTTLVAEPGTTVRYRVDLTARGSGSRP